MNLEDMTVDVTPEEVDPALLLLRSQTNKHYFQYRIDKLPEGNRHPRIVIGVCKESFDINTELSRQRDAWCFTLYSGDKFTNKRWKGYYETDEAAYIKDPPKYGFFEVGSIIGICVDLDRGFINLYKDGNDLG